jgi:hypothetical protein
MINTQINFQYLTQARRLDAPSLQLLIEAHQRHWEIWIRTINTNKHWTILNLQNYKQKNIYFFRLL